MPPWVALPSNLAVSPTYVLRSKLLLTMQNVERLKIPYILEHFTLRFLLSVYLSADGFFEHKRLVRIGEPSLYLCLASVVNAALYFAQSRQTQPHSTKQ